LALKKITKNLRLSLADIPEDQREEYKNEIGELVLDEILRSVGNGKSPVDGYGAFEKLNATYAKEQKGGNRTANLELDGDMLDSLEYKTTEAGIEIGIFKSSEVGKADGHNDFSGKSKLPTRRFIPKGTEKFDKDIQDKIKTITNDFSKKKKFDVAPELLDTLSAGQSANAAVTIDDLFSESAFNALLAGI